MGIDTCSSNEQGQEKQVVYRIFENPIAWNYCGLHTVNLDDPIGKMPLPMYGSYMNGLREKLPGIARCTTPVTKERIVEVPQIKYEVKVEKRIKPVIWERIHVLPKITYEEKVEYEDVHEYREVPVDRIVQMEPTIEYVEQEALNYPKTFQDEPVENSGNIETKDADHQCPLTARAACPCCQRDWHYYWDPIAASDTKSTILPDESHACGQWHGQIPTECDSSGMSRQDEPQHFGQGDGQIPVEEYSTGMSQQDVSHSHGQGGQIPMEEYSTGMSHQESFAKSETGTSAVTVTPTITITEKPDVEKTKELKQNAVELDEASKEKLKKVLGGNKIELVMKPAATPDDQKDSAYEEGFEAKLHLKEPVDFKPVHHGDMPAAEFKHESKAQAVLGDVAEVLKIYPKAILLVEGHTATPPEKMDKWAHDLAQARAEKVKSTIVSYSIDASRLNTIGLPGNLGSGKHDTVLKITSF